MNHGLSNDRKIGFWLTKIGDLPTLPSVVHQTIRVVNDPNSSIRQISEALLHDPSLSIKVLRLANSGYYAIPGGAATIERAITALGIGNVSQMVFTAAVFSQFDLESQAPFSVREFWRHSLGVAIASETIAREIGVRDSAIIFLAGLVHDIGKIAHFQIAKDEWLTICKHAQAGDITIVEAEKEMSVVSHDELGYELVRKWQLPLLIQEVVHLHHDGTAQAAGGNVTVHSQAVGIVYLANLLVHSMRVGSSGHNAIRNPSKDVVVRILGNEKALGHVAKSTRKALERMGPLFLTMYGSAEPTA
jgi:putative nucleotidyltransferase with HDIG domain